MCVATTDAPISGSFLVSVISPIMDDVVTPCAKALPEKANSARKATTRESLYLGFIMVSCLVVGLIEKS